MDVYHSFSIKNIFYDKMKLRFFHFRVTIYLYQYFIAIKFEDMAVDAITTYRYNQWQYLK